MQYGVSQSGTGSISTAGLTLTWRCTTTCCDVWCAGLALLGFPIHNAFENSFALARNDNLALATSGNLRRWESVDARCFTLGSKLGLAVSPKLGAANSPTCSDASSVNGQCPEAGYRMLGS